MFCDDLGEWDGGEGGGRQGPKGLNICIHMLCIHIAGASLVAQLVKNLPTVQDPGSNPRSGRSSGEGNGQPL